MFSVFDDLMGNLTCYACAASVSTYGIQDYFIGNTDIKLTLEFDKMLKDTHVIINGEIDHQGEEEQDEIEDDDYLAYLARLEAEDATTEQKQALAASKPFKWVTSDGRYLSIYYDY